MNYSLLVYISGHLKCQLVLAFSSAKLVQATLATGGIDVVLDGPKMSWETQTTFTISKGIPFFLVLNAALCHDCRIRNNWDILISGLFSVRSSCTFLQPRPGSVFCCLLIDSLQISP